MGRYSTWPTLIDDLKCLDIKELREWGYLQEGIRKSGNLTWSRNGMKTAAISIMAIIDHNPRLLLSYSVNGEPMKYNVLLAEVQSNLGKGSYFQFVCPKTFKRCRKLHLINGYFMHRSVLSNAMYETQTQSKSYRRIKGIFEPYVLQDEYYRELHKPYFKTHYNGRPTKRYLWLMEKLRMADKMTLQQYESLLMFGA
ncbi:hypothetical protein [Allomuricauda sp.]|uniref:hypothetical protein n=1 Tax=Flagellimonas alginolytica TaxID=3177515 RepID=UPI0025E7D377|nr:hypothetical protein [Allomuricauda sp.]